MTTTHERSLYEIEKEIVEESIRNNPDNFLSLSMVKEVTEPRLRVELWCKYLRQECLWTEPKDDPYRDERAFFPTKSMLREIVTDMETLLLNV